MAWVLDEVRHPDLLDFKAPCVTTVYDWDKPSSPRPPARAAAVAPREASADPDAHGQQPYRIPAAAPVADSDTADGLNDDCQNTAAVEPLSLPALPYNSGIASILSLFSPTSSATADSQASCAPQLLHVSAPSAPEQASGSTCAASASKPPDASPHAIAHAEELAALGTEEAKQAESAGKSTPASRHPDAIRPSQLKVATTGRHAASAAHEQAATADGILLDNVSPAQQHSDAGRTTNLGTATAASSQDTTQDPASTTVQQQSAAADMTAPPAAAADTSAKPLAASTIHLDAACLQRVADQVGMRADCVKAADDALNQVLGNPSCQQDTVLRDPVQSTNGIIKAAMEAMLQSAPLRNRRTSDSGAQTVPSATQAADMDVTRLGSCTVRRRPSSASGAQTTQTVPALVPAADAGLSSTCDSCHPEVVAASAQQCIHSADHTTGHSGSGSKAITVLDTQLPVLQEVIPGVDQQIYEGHLKDTLSNSGKSFASPTKRDAERPSSDAANAAHGRKEPAQAAVAADSASISEPRLNHPHISTGAAVNETPDTTAKDAAADATALATADFHKQKRNESEVFGSIELTADESTGDGSSATNLGPELATSPAAQDVGQESQSLQEPMLDVVARVPAINEHPSSHEDGGWEQISLSDSGSCPKASDLKVTAATGSATASQSGKAADALPIADRNLHVAECVGSQQHEHLQTLDKAAHDSMPVQGEPAAHLHTCVPSGQLQQGQPKEVRLECTRQTQGTPLPAEVVLPSSETPAFSAADVDGSASADSRVSTPARSTDSGAHGGMTAPEEPAQAEIPVDALRPSLSERVSHFTAGWVQSYSSIFRAPKPAEPVALVPSQVAALGLPVIPDSPFQDSSTPPESPMSPFSREAWERVSDIFNQDDDQSLSDVPDSVWNP